MFYFFKDLIMFYLFNDILPNKQSYITIFIYNYKYLKKY